MHTSLTSGVPFVDYNPSLMKHFRSCDNWYRHAIAMLALQQTINGVLSFQWTYNCYSRFNRIPIFSCVGGGGW